MGHLFHSRANRLLFVLAGLAAILGVAGCEIDSDDIEFIQLNEVRALLEEPETDGIRPIILLDPRSTRAFDAGHIPGARSVSIADLPSDADRSPALTVHKHIIVYGDDRGSAIADATTKRLMEIGYDRVRMFEGGLQAWVGAGLPIESTPLATDEASTPPAE